MTAEGRRLRDLTRSSHVDDVEPAWSHDGRRIAFATARGREVFDHTGSPYRLDEVYVMRASGLSPHRVIASAGSNEEPAWSPNGAQRSRSRATAPATKTSG